MKTILIIESNLEIRENLTELLELNGFATLSADSVVEAIILLNQCWVDMILGNLKPNCEETKRLINFLQSRDNLSRISVVSMSSTPLKVEKQEVLNIGMDEYLVKPFSENELIVSIKKALIYRAWKELKRCLRNNKNSYQAFHQSIPLFSLN